MESRQDDCKLYPETLQVLERLSGRYPLIISSNTIREFLLVQLRKLPSVFRHVFSAPSDFGTVKDPDFYSRISDLIGVELGAIIHVGDNVAFDYEAPREAGMIAFHLDRSGDSGRDHVIRTLVDFEERLIGLEGNNTN